MDVPGKPDQKVQHLGPETCEGPPGIYVHVPFCQSKCPYCSFVSYQDAGPDAKQSYMDALGMQARDMAAHPWTMARKFRSLYIGGGTPSAIDVLSMAHFIDICLAGFDFDSIYGREPEVTLEANPNTVSREMLEILRRAGVNRLSIGTQSFSDAMLKAIGRKHSARDCVRAVKDARDAGFENISLDLMYGLPGQDLENWQESLEQAVGLDPEHLSVYELTIEKQTPFADLARQGKLNLPDENTTLAMFELARDFLSAEGYGQYEISSYAREGLESVHNLNYWENGSYVGLGSGAVSCFSGLRLHSEEKPERFISMIHKNRKPFREGEFLSLKARFRESVIMGLRMTAGVSIPMLEKQYALSPQEYYGEALKVLIKQEFMEKTKSRLRLTKKGMLVANQVMSQLV